MHGVNEERVKLWIKALRSGEYTQCKSVLEQQHVDLDGTVTKSHCCLGVAMRVALANGYIDQDESDLEWGSEGMDFHIAREWFGFTKQQGGGNPDLGYYTDEHGAKFNTSCVQANDDLGWDFGKIADALETRYISLRNIEREA